MPFIGWLVGIVLVSEAWARRDKIVGIGLALLPIVLPLLVVTLEANQAKDMEPVPAGGTRPGGLPEARSDSGAGVAELFALFMLAGLPSALFLGWRLRRRPSPPSAGGS